MVLDCVGRGGPAHRCAPEQLVVGAPARDGLVGAAGRGHEDGVADGDVAAVLVAGVDHAQGRGGGRDRVAREPLDARGRVGAPHAAGEHVLAAGGDRLRRRRDARALRRD